MSREFLDQSDDKVPQEFYNILKEEDTDSDWEPENSGDAVGSSDFIYNEFKEEQEEEEEDPLHMPAAVSPLSSPIRDRSPLRPRFRISVDEPLPDEPLPDDYEVTPGNDQPPIEPSGVVRGRISIRGGHRGAGRSRGGRGGAGQTREGRGRRGRIQVGEPLRQKFVSDEDLPEDLRRNIQIFLARNGRRSDPAAAHGVGEDEEAVEYYEALGMMGDFEWRPIDDTTTVNREPFLVNNAGPTRCFNSAYTAFRAYWDDAILAHIERETNAYAQTIRSVDFQQRWRDTSVDEILLLFAFWMMLGIVRMPTIKACFTKHPLLRTDVFRNLFTEDRYWKLNRAFVMARDSRDANNDVLYPVKHVMDHLHNKFREAYVPAQDICIDESLTLWKGPLSFRQYIKSKAARFGIKTQHLCESTTGYLWSFFVYVGSKTTTSPLSVSVSTVLKLARPLLDKGYTLFMDNWFNSPMLARYLKSKKTDCIGTLRSNRLHVPPIIQLAPLAVGEFVARTSGDVRVAALLDRKRLTMISTYHDFSQIRIEARPGRPSQYRLQMVDDYNKGMGGVDRLDQMLEPYMVERKQCSKWTMKLFKRMLNVSIQNARVLYEKSVNKKMDSLVFRLALVQSIIDRHRHIHYERFSLERPRLNNLEQFPADRLVGRHWIERNAADDDKPHVKASNRGRRHCVWCYHYHHRKTIRTGYICEQCTLPLCITCFKAYHTVTR